MPDALEGFLVERDGKRRWDDYNWQPPTIIKTGRPPCPQYLDPETKKLKDTRQGDEEFHLALFQHQNKALANLWSDWYFKSDGSNIDEFLRDCVFIHDKNGYPCRLDVDNPNYRRAQRYYLHKVTESIQRRGSFFGVVLKARQWGCSMLTVGILLWYMLSRESFQCISAADDDKKSEGMMERLRDMLDNMPPWIKPNQPRGGDSADRVKFDGWPDTGPLNKRKCKSWIRVFTAGAKSFGRSFTIQGFHGSEVAFWDLNTAKKAHTGVTDSMPVNAKNVFVVWESTANGFGSIHATLWEGAESGENFHTPIFIPWFWIDEYRLDKDDAADRFPNIDYDTFCRFVQEKQVRKAKLDDDEIALVNRFNVSGPQLLWRRIKIALKGGDLHAFKQENPSTPEEAFIVDGDPVFDQRILAEYMRNAHDAKWTYKLVNHDIHNIDPDSTFIDEHGNKRKTLELVEDKDGKIKVWGQPKLGREYVVSVDPSEGQENEEGRVTDGDDTAITVVDRNERAVVCTAVGRFPPDVAADIVFTLAYWFNRALVVVEANSGFGITTISRGKELCYEGMYRRQVYDNSMNSETTIYGYRTTQITRPMMFSTARGDIRRCVWKIWDLALLKQMSTMVYKKGRNSTGNMKELPAGGGHDDRVMSFCICVQVCRDMGMLTMEDAEPKRGERELPPNLSRMERRVLQEEWDQDDADAAGGSFTPL